MRAALLLFGWRWGRGQVNMLAVVQLCKGSCMFLEGDFFKQSCANEFAFNMGIMMAAVWHLTGKVVVSALSETA